MAVTASNAPSGTPDAVMRGFDLSAFKTSALAQNPSQQRGHWLGLVSSALGTQIGIQMYRNGALAFSSTYQGQLAVSDGTLTVPQSPTTVGQNSPVPSTGAWTLRVSNSSDTSIYIEAAVTLSEALDGVKEVIFDYRFYPPPTLGNQFDLITVGSTFQNANGETVRLSGGNMYAGPMPYKVADYYETGQELDRVCKFNAGILDQIAQDHPGFNCLRLTVSPLVVAKTGDTYDYPAQVSLLVSIIEACQARGWWVMVSPYGMGWYSDFESRARKNQAGNDPNKANDDPTQPNAEDGTQDETNNAAVRTEVKAMLDNLVPAIIDCDNVIFCGLNEWRQVSAATWEVSERDIRDHLRSLGYNKLYIADGYNWALDLDATRCRALVDDDPAGNNRMAFSVHGYIDQGTPGTENAAATQVQRAATLATINDGIPVIIGEYGNQIQLSSEPQAITEQEILDWQTTYVSNHLNCAGLLSWQVGPWDQHSEYNDRIDGWNGPILQDEPLALNATGLHRVELQRQFRNGEMDGEFPSLAEWQSVAEQSMVFTTEFSEDRMLHGVNADFGRYYPQATTTPESGYTERYWIGTTREPGYADPQLFPFTHIWESQTGAYGSAHTNRPAHDRVAAHVAKWFLCVFYDGDADWTIAYQDRDWVLEGESTIYTGDFANFSQPSPIYTFEDGSKGTTVYNASGITQPSQTKFIHAWPLNGKYTIPGAEVENVLAICTGHLARLETVNGGTASDIANAKLLSWPGTDIYTASGNDPFTRPGTMVGRPTFLTGDWKPIIAHMHRDGQAASNQFIIDNPLPDIS